MFPFPSRDIISHGATDIVRSKLRARITWTWLRLRLRQTRISTRTFPLSMTPVIHVLLLIRFCLLKSGGSWEEITADISASSRGDRLCLLDENVQSDEIPRILEATFGTWVKTYDVRNIASDIRRLAETGKKIFRACLTRPRPRSESWIATRNAEALTARTDGPWKH